LARRSKRPRRIRLRRNQRSQPGGAPVMPLRCCALALLRCCPVAPLPSCAVAPQQSRAASAGWFAPGCWRRRTRQRRGAPRHGLEPVVDEPYLVMGGQSAGPPRHDPIHQAWLVSLASRKTWLTYSIRKPVRSAFWPISPRREARAYWCWLCDRGHVTCAHARRALRTVPSTRVASCDATSPSNAPGIIGI
jgi:hypothetical protein